MNAIPPTSGRRAARAQGHPAASTQEHRAARPASRSSRSTPSETPLALRRTAIGLAAFALALLAGAASALSFEDLRLLALAGRADPQLAYLYPAAFDILLVVALVCVPLLRGVRPLVRLQAGFILLLLLLSAAGAAVANATEATFDPQKSAIVVALLPWVMLVLGLWLLLLLLKHARTNRADLDDEDDDEDDDEEAGAAEDFVPFERERRQRRPSPVQPSASSPIAPQATASDPAGTAAAPAASSAAAHPDEAAEEERPPAVADAVRPPAATTPEADAVTMSQESVPQEPAPQESVPQEPAPQHPVAQAPAAHITATQSSGDEQSRAAEPAGDRPLRWGDLVRPHTGDVLVHSKHRDAATTAEDEHASTGSEAVDEAPSSDPAPGPMSAPVPDPSPTLEPAAEPMADESGFDTQPPRQISAAPDPDPAHAADTADPEERVATEKTDNRGEDDTENDGSDNVPLAPPSGRMRSTPLPPQ